MVKLCEVVLLLYFAYVQAGTVYSATFEAMDIEMRVMTNVNGAECGSVYNANGSVVCDGGLEKQLLHGTSANPPATNAIPAVQNVVLKYEVPH